MSVHRLVVALALLGCQGKTDPKPAATGSDPAVSRAEPAPKVEHRTAPPLPEPLPGKRRDVTALVGKAARAAIGDLDGDGKAELVVVDPDAVRVIDRAGSEVARAPADGGIQVLLTADLDGDHKAEIIAGWGESREHRDTAAKVTLLRLDKGKLAEEVVLAPTTSRNDIVAAIPDGPRLVIAYFDSKYTVTKVTATHAAAGWTTSDTFGSRMATTWGLGDLTGGGHPSLIIGRLYGDAKGADGDVFALAADGSRTTLPTTRGVQSLAVADTDGDGRAEVFVGDGWHQNYIQNAQGLLTWIRMIDGAPRAELIEDTPGQYAINQIVVADVDGDGKPELVTRGNSYVRVYKRTGDAWRGLTIAGPARDVAVGDLDGGGNAILVLGEHSEVVDLHGVTWP